MEMATIVGKRKIDEFEYNPSEPHFKVVYKKGSLDYVLGFWYTNDSGLDLRYDHPIKKLEKNTYVPLEESDMLKLIGNVTCEGKDHYILLDNIVFSSNSRL